MRDAEERAIATTGPAGGSIVRILRPIAGVAEAVDAWNDYQKLCQALLTDEDYQGIQNKRFKKKSAWRKLGNVFGISVVPTDKTLLRADPNDPTTPVVFAEFTVQATAPNGRTMGGWGACSIHEDRNFSKPDHDIPATAMTRAVNRAISDLVGAGEVSAEEVESDAGQAFDRSAARVVAGGALATPAQIKAIYIITRNERALTEEETDNLCRRLYGSRVPTELGKREASELIDRLKSNKELEPRAPTSEATSAAPQAAAPPPAKKTPNGKPTNVDDNWTTFWTTAKDMGYKDEAAVAAGLGAKSINQWIDKGGTMREALELLAKLADVEGGK